jgi:hypothetical protein
VDHRPALALVLAAVTCLTACAPANTPDPLPPNFPNIKGYTDIGEQAPFWRAAGKSIGWTFAGPGGLACWVNTFGGYPARAASCEGLRPDVAPGVWSVGVGEGGAGGGLTLNASRTPRQGGAPALPSRHFLRYEESDMLCAMDGDGTLGCRIGAHGFVVTATTTTLF